MVRRAWWALLLWGCEGGAPREADAGPAFETTESAGGYVVRFAGPPPYRVAWTVAGDTSTFRLERSGRAPIGPVALDVAPRDRAAAERASLLLYGADLAADGAAGSPLTATGLVGNHAGCDDVDLVPGLISCGRGPLADAPDKGGCCDVHDACISAHCTGCNDSGNVIKCLRPGGTWDCSEACAACHRAVIACFLDADDHGESDCCARGDCGRPQQCLIDDAVVTDANACCAAGVDSADGCPPGSALCGACDEGLACDDEGRCCAPAGAPAGEGACRCCSGRAAAGVCE